MIDYILSVIDINVAFSTFLVLAVAEAGLIQVITRLKKTRLIYSLNKTGHYDRLIRSSAQNIQLSGLGLMLLVLVGHSVFSLLLLSLNVYASLFSARMFYLLWRNNKDGE